ncbi:MAG: aromatic amino acid aminotransferase [Gammaproteobacteria bacterium]|nr:MAG: aromatic amino acid aminotransferase [Gammaproteobacteria bacterium]
MFEQLEEPKADAILALMAAFREDPRTDKLDLGVGIYKDEDGRSTVMHAIKDAETSLLETQDTKAYVSPAGSAEFNAAMIDLVLGESASERHVAVQAVGGSGALAIIAGLLKQIRPNATVWLSDPTWPNHGPLIGSAGFTLANYPYYDNATSTISFDAMLETLSSAAEGDIVVLHGCCHNPTGADLDLEQWQAVAKLLREKKLFAFVDLAYQGFGDGLEEDAAGVRLLARELDEFAIAASCSKNFALYRERVGAAILQAASAEDAQRAHKQLSRVARSIYSMPPDHGANSANLVLGDKARRKSWQDELETMRSRMQRLRTGFAEAMRKRSNSDRFDYIAAQKGMFSRLPLSSEQLTRLREEYGIYIVGDGRINIAGLPDDGLEQLADRICSVME